MARQTVLPVGSLICAVAPNSKPSPREEMEMVSVTLPVSRLTQLLSSGALRVCDLQCLDQKSKGAVWSALLDSLRCVPS